MEWATEKIGPWAWVILGVAAGGGIYWHSQQPPERFGIALADPYRWMEDADSEEMREWLSGQAACATSVLAGVRLPSPGR
jgi:Prolyl oligopeptidase, N-terminal beta-propeller domain